LIYFVAAILNVVAILALVLWFLPDPPPGELPGACPCGRRLRKETDGVARSSVCWYPPEPPA
jgi:hypothetical protein